MSGSTEPVQDRINVALGGRGRDGKSQPLEFKIRHFRHWDDRCLVLRDRVSILGPVDRVGKVEGGQELDGLRRLHERVKALAATVLLLLMLASLLQPLKPDVQSPVRSLQLLLLKV